MAQDPELAAMSTVAGALSKLDKEAVTRVLAWVGNKYGVIPSPSSQSTSGGSENRGQNTAAATNGKSITPTHGGKEIAGLTRLNGDGKVEITVRDPKGRSAGDTAKRLIYLAIRAAQLLGQETVSRKELLNPLLTRWRLNNGNTRRMIGSDRGLLKSGDSLSLDIPAAKEADEFLREALDPTVDGGWKPGTGRRTSKKTGKTTDRKKS